VGGGGKCIYIPVLPFGFGIFRGRCLSFLCTLQVVTYAYTMFPQTHNVRFVSRFEFHVNSEGTFITERSYMLSDSNVFILVLNNDKHSTNYFLNVGENKINYPIIKGLNMRTGRREA
jgi:hypothetical protein